jgi:hypothetical protein
MMTIEMMATERSESVQNRARGGLAEKTLSESSKPPI